MVLDRKEETEGQEWFEHWRRMNAKMEWQFDPMWVFQPNSYNDKYKYKYKHEYKHKYKHKCKRK